MSRGDAARATDIIEAIGAIRVAESVLRRHTEADVETTVIDALTYRVITIGEAVKALSEEAVAAHPSVPWSRIARMRDLLTHHYFRRDAQVVLTTVEQHLADVEDACQALVRQDSIDLASS